MATFRETPYGKMNFLVDLGTGETSSAQAGFSEVILPEITVKYVAYRNGNERLNTARKKTGTVITSNAIFKRGVIGSLDLVQWFNQVRSGDQEDALRTIRIELLSEDRSVTALTWTLVNARPVKMSFGSLNATSEDIAVEYLEVACDDVQFE
ncbi:MAG: phage tail protein [Rhodothermaceae bacterium]|nr:phage tail protein [Rhodothermaceae bacterium]